MSNSDIAENIVLNSIMLDSCILIENLKGTRTEILPLLWDNPTMKLCICETIVSEFLFHFLALQYGKAPLTAKMNQDIPVILQERDPTAFLHHFVLLPSGENTPDVALRLMQKHNLLPNDALILALSLEHNVSRLATFDPDLLRACKHEQVAVISQSSDIQ
jgi:uncharacterized protein